MKIFLDKKEIVVGDKINFKLDTEQEGEIVEIHNDQKETSVLVKGAFSGILANEKTFMVELSRCWLSRGYKTMTEKQIKKEKIKKAKKIATIEDGVKVMIGDWVSFKCDVEQSGKIKDIVTSSGVQELIIENENGFDGDYIGGETTTTERAASCWKEGV